MPSMFRIMMSQSFPPKAKWTQKDIPDLSGKVIIVTGGKSGIGRETIKALLQHNAKVYLAARGQKDAEQVIKELEKVTGKKAIFLDLDLADLKNVRKAADEFLSKEKELHVLFNNAGLMFPELDMVTKDGYDAQWGIHVVGAHLFTKILMPALLAGAQSSKDGKARVVTTSSSGAYMEKDIHYDTLKPGPARTAYGKQNLYFGSKLGQAIWARELASRYGDQNIISVSLNPGNLRTGLQRHQGAVMSFMLRAILHPVDPYGPITQLWGATSPEILKGENGAFLAPWARFGPVPEGALAPGVGTKLWDYLEKETANF